MVLDSYRYPTVKIGWDDASKLFRVIQETSPDIPFLYVEGRLYLTKKEEIVKLMDMLRIKYIITPPSNTEVYLNDVL